MITTAINERTIPLISKSRFLAGLQCQKSLWTMCNAKHLIPPPDAAAQAIFEQGTEVGKLARKLFTNSIEVHYDTNDLDELVCLTQEAVKARKPLFEAAFSHQGGYARADVLDPAEGDFWDLFEVKSSTSIKDVYIFDLAFQAFVIAGAGLKIRRCFLLLINPEFIRHGDVDPGKFFVRHDVTDQVLAVSDQIEVRLREMLTTIRLNEQPHVRIGGQCNNPFPCPLQSVCWSFLPTDNVTTLYRGGKKGFDLLASGISQVKDIPNGFPLTENQEIQRQVAIAGQPFINKTIIEPFLRQLKHPLSFLDFETLSTAIPLFDGAWPYQQICFQYSLHIVRSPNAAPEHFAFLAEGTDDPRSAFMRSLRDALPTEGSVIAFNSAFELARLRECSELMPEFKTWVSEIKRRTLDLLIPFRQFAFYHPKQHGSCSMKEILPALTGKTYIDLTIQNGTAASLQFLRATFGNLLDGECSKIREYLHQYCCLDTLGMVEILSALEDSISEQHFV